MSVFASLMGCSSFTMSGSTIRFLPLRVLLISPGPMEPYRWPSSVALASMVTAGRRDELLGEHLQVRDPGLAGLLDLDLVLVEGPQVLFRRDDGVAVGEEVVAGVAGLDLDDFALLADVFEVVDEHDERAAVRPLLHLVAAS